MSETKPICYNSLTTMLGLLLSFAVLLAVNVTRRIISEWHISCWTLDSKESTQV